LINKKKHKRLGVTIRLLEVRAKQGFTKAIYPNALFRNLESRRNLGVNP